MAGTSRIQPHRPLPRRLGGMGVAWLGLAILAAAGLALMAVAIHAQRRADSDLLGRLDQNVIRAGVGSPLMPGETRPPQGAATTPAGSSALGPVPAAPAARRGATRRATKPTPAANGETTFSRAPTGGTPSASGSRGGTSAGASSGATTPRPVVPVRTRPAPTPPSTSSGSGAQTASTTAAPATTTSSGGDHTPSGSSSDAKPATSGSDDHGGSSGGSGDSHKSEDD